MDALLMWPTWMIVTALLVLMMWANEAGFRIGRWRHRNEPEPVQAVSNTLKASVFGLVALLLGFSFSITSNRHDDRRRVVLDEANSLGTCYLRAGLLGEPDRVRIRSTIRQYVLVRLEYFDKALDASERNRTSAEMDRFLVQLWQQVEQATRTNHETVRTSQIIPAANEVIDISGTRAWMVRSHLPTPVFALLIACVVVSSILMGHSSGQAGTRHKGLWTALNLLLVLLLFVVLDFDRPRRGFVTLDHTPLTELLATFETIGN